MLKALRRWGIDGGTVRLRAIGFSAAFVLALTTAFSYPHLPEDWHLRVLAPGWMPQQLVKLIEYSNDLQVALVADRPSHPHAKVAVVLIREETLAELPYTSPVDRALLSRLVRAIDNLGARAIGIDILFDRSTEPEKDQLLLRTFAARRADIVLGGADERTPSSQRQRGWQTAFLADSAKRYGYFNLRYDVREAEQSNVVRVRAAPHPGSMFERSFAEALAVSAGVTHFPESRRIPWLRRGPGGGDPFVTLDADAILAADADASGVLARLLEAQIDGRVVLVGADLDGRDRHPTPLTLISGEDMLGVLVHAQILAGLIDRRSIDDVSPGARSLLGFVAAFIGFLAGWFAGRRTLVLSALITVASLAIIVTSAIVLWQSQAIVPLAALVATLVAGAVAGRFGRRWLIG